MVVDPLLADHLTHFGVDIMSMQKVTKVDLYYLGDTDAVCSRLDMCCDRVFLLHKNSSAETGKRLSEVAGI